MITNLKTYEGVPIGGNNFESFISYVRAFLGANFGFSTNVSGNQGGYFDEDDFVFTAKDATSPADSAYFFGPQTNPVGSMFGKLDTEYYRFDVLNNTTEDPQVNVWTLLLTGGVANENFTELSYENTSPENLTLPYRPLRKNDSSQYLYGYQDIRINGIPQAEGSDIAFSGSVVSNFYNQSLTISRIRLGAEFPEPVRGGRYDGLMIDPENGITRDNLVSVYGGRLTFPNSNLSSAQGSNVVLWRRLSGIDYFSYVPQSFSSSSQNVPSGTYRIIDQASGEIELVVSTEQLEQLRAPGEVITVSDIPFIVVVPEQLREETIGGVTNYSSRFGSIYNGDTSSVLLGEYFFNGSRHIVRSIPSQNYSGASGRVLLQDTTQNYQDSTILAFAYSATPNKNAITEAQSSRYNPDVITLYYNSGLILPTASGTSSIRTIVERNTGSWYNRDVLDSGYFPVSRTDEAFYSLLPSYEAALFTYSFEPDSSFQIIDTIGLEDLNDVPSVINDGDVLVYDGTTFVAIPFSINSLVSGNSGAAEHSVLTRGPTISGDNTWLVRTPTQMLQATDITGVFRYNAEHSLGGASNSRALVHRAYVDNSIANAVSGSSVNSPNTLVRRDASNRFEVASPISGQQATNLSFVEGRIANFSASAGLYGTPFPGFTTDSTGLTPEPSFTFHSDVTRVWHHVSGGTAHVRFTIGWSARSGSGSSNLENGYLVLPSAFTDYYFASQTNRFLTASYSFSDGFVVPAGRSLHISCTSSGTIGSYITYFRFGSQIQIQNVAPSTLSFLPMSAFSSGGGRLDISVVFSVDRQV